MTKARNTSKLGHMVMAWKHQEEVDCCIYFLMHLLVEKTD